MFIWEIRKKYKSEYKIYHKVINTGELFILSYLWDLLEFFNYKNDPYVYYLDFITISTFV